MLLLNQKSIAGQVLDSLDFPIKHGINLFIIVVPRDMQSAIFHGHNVNSFAETNKLFDNIKFCWFYLTKILSAYLMDAIVLDKTIISNV